MIFFQWILPNVQAYSGTSTISPLPYSLLVAGNMLCCHSMYCWMKRVWKLEASPGDDHPCLQVGVDKWNKKVGFPHFDVTTFTDLTLRLTGRFINLNFYSNSKIQGAGVLQSVYWLSCWLERWRIVIRFPTGTRKVSSPFYGTMKVETVGFCKVMAHIYQTTRCYVQEGNQLNVGLIEHNDKLWPAVTNNDW